MAIAHRPQKISLLGLQQSLVHPLLNPEAYSWDELATIVERVGAPKFLQQTKQHGLAPLWFERIGQNTPDTPVFQKVLPALRQERISNIGTSAIRLAHAKQVQQNLFASNIPSVIFKGMHLSLAVYPESALRPSADIDILIPSNLKKQATHSLLKTGAKFEPTANTIDYQCAFHLEQQEVDLHWHLVRQGRVTAESNQIMLQNPTKIDGLIVPNDTAALFAMLTHPLLSTRPGAQDSKLVRLIDLAFWLRQRQPDMGSISGILERTGTQPVAWLMNEWLKRVTHEELSLPFPARLIPSKRKQKWLARWLPGENSRIGYNNGLAVQLGYRTALHNSIGSALQELLALTKCRATATRELRHFLCLIANGRD